MIHWGILGAGNIARRFAESLRHEPSSKLEAISLRSEEKAVEFGKKYEYDRYYLNYDELVNDEKIDAVYISLPHGMHKEWAIKCLKAKKAVLCEKPATLSYAEMSEVVKAAKENNCLFMEAMKSRFVPVYGKIHELINNGIIGDIQYIDAVLCSEMPFEKMENTYHRQPLQGGALLDTGIYCASWIEDYVKGQLKLESLNADIRNGIDYYVNASLISSEGIKVRLETGFDCKKPKNVIIQGSKGRIEIFDQHRPQRFSIITDHIETIEKEYFVDDFYGEISHFVNLLIAGKKESEIMPLQASLRCARILDTIRDGFNHEK